MPKVLSYEDKEYKNQESKRWLYDCLYQTFLDLKQERCKVSGWNLPIQELSGLTMKLVSEDTFSLTAHRVDSGTIEEMATKKPIGQNVIKEVMTELKKKFKKYTRKNVKS